MLTVIAGEDSVASRNIFVKLIQSYKNKNFDIQSVELEDIVLLATESDGVTNLFGQQQIYTVQNASKKYKGRTKTAYKSALQTIAKDKHKLLIDWEEGKSAYDLSSLKRIATNFQESKAHKTIFQVLEDCYPGNIKQFLNSYHAVLHTQDASFIFAMLCKHMRKLIQAQNNIYEKGTQSWQRMNIDQQASLWDPKKLKMFYNALARIDIANKTQSSPYNLEQSLEILVCYYL